MSGGQRLPDLFFQTLARGIVNPPDPASASTVRDILDRVLASQFIPLPPASDSLDSLNWKEVSSELDWQGTGGEPLLKGRHTRRDIRLDQNIVPATASPGLDWAGLDQYFAQTADDSGQTTEDE